MNSDTPELAIEFAQNLPAISEYFDPQRYADIAAELIINYLPRVFLALIALIIGLTIVRYINRLVQRALTYRKTDPSLVSFLESLISIVLKIGVFITVASMIGVQMTSFIAILGAASLAVGLSLQGSLANFAGGVLILLFKPFKVGDYIEALGYQGTVKKIQITTTVLLTLDNKNIVIPNGNLSNNPIENWTAQPERRLDMEFGIGYGDDLKKAKDVIASIVTNDDEFLDKPEPFVGVSELGDSAVKLVVRVWVKTNDYIRLSSKLPEIVKLAFDKNGISIPYPQQDVRLIKND